MGRWWITAARAALLAAGLSPVRSAAAQQPDLSVKRMGAARLTVEAGGLATLIFQLSNRSATERTVQGAVDLPPGWQLVIPEQAVTLPSREEDLRLLRIALPAHAAAGLYVLRYGVAGTGARDSVLVAVPERRRIGVAVREAPRFITAGAAYEVLFELRNTGNAPALIRLALSGSDGVPARLDSAAVRLEAGREQVVRARVQSSERITHTVSHRVRLLVTVEGDTTHIEPSVSVVEIVPRHTERAPRFRSLPSQLTVRQVDHAQRPTVELRGGGALSSGGATRVEFLLRGPEQTASLFGDQDEYWLSLSTPRYQLRLGDRAAPYARLGESWRPGFGAEGDLTVGGVTIGGFAQRDRRSYGTLHEERGGRLGVRPFGQLLTEARYVSRTGANAGDIWTAHGLLNQWRAATFDADVGRGRDSTGQGGAYAVAVTGAFPRASYSLRRLVADSGFPGLTRGTSSSEASATVVPVSRLSISMSATDWTAFRTRVFTNQSSTWQRAVDGRIAWGGLLEAGYRQSMESRIVLAVPRKRHSESARLSAALPLGIAALRAGIEEGFSTFDHTPLQRMPFRRVTVQGSLGRGENLLAASAEWLTGTASSSWVPEDRVQGALNAGLRLTPSTRLTTSVSVTRYRGDRPRTPMMLDVAVVQNLPFGQRASGRTRAVSYGPGVPAIRPTYQADYVVPFGLPVGMSRASGTVLARLVDLESGRPLAGVLVHIGDRVRFTDADGAVAFKGLTEATHYLEVDRAALDAGRVVVPAAVLGVAIRSGETRSIQLGVVHGAGVRGSVRRLDALESPSLGAPRTLVDSGTITGAVLQLSNGTDSLRALVDGWGRFSFTDLVPGSWVLSVVQADLPRYHRFEQDRVALELRPGDTREVELRVMPSAPPVQMIAQAELTLEGSSDVPHARPATTKSQSTQWSSTRRRIVPPPARPGSAAARRSATNTPPWQTGRRRYVPAPSRAESAPDATMAPPAPKHRYTVTRWDVSLMRIARVMYDDASLWPKIWLANLDQVKNPDVIRAGQQLRIPDKGPLSVAEREAGERYLIDRRRP